jgi:hypothetical protein
VFSLDTSGAAANAGGNVVALSGDPFITPQHGLVLRHADGRWIASYDPYLAASNLPAGVEAAAPGAGHSIQFDEAQLGALRLLLLGHNATPNEAVPSWQPAGFYSDWLDEHDVSDAGLILMKSASAPWTPTP